MDMRYEDEINYSLTLFKQTMHNNNHSHHKTKEAPLVVFKGMKGYALGCITYTCIKMFIFRKIQKDNFDPRGAKRAFPSIQVLKI